jgi:uncharacterized protein YdeI (YjbR/CyaY-like superfamily)
MNSERESLDVVDRQAWRSWLDANASSVSEAWLLVQKKSSRRPGLSLDEAVDEALCYGWIHSTLQPRDDHSYLLRFSPRRPDSVWSVKSIDRVERLEREGLMKPPGLAAVQVGKESGQWQAAINRDDLAYIPPELEAALQQTAGAMEGYQGLPESKKKQLIYWFESAKREETKQKRTVEIIRLALEGLS